MIKHIVSWKLSRKNGEKEVQINADAIKSALDKLPALIEQIKFFEVGKNLSSSKNAYDLILVSEFDSMEALEIYRQHPEHQKVVQLIGKHAEKSMVVDYQN